MDEFFVCSGELWKFEKLGEGFFPHGELSKSMGGVSDQAVGTMGIAKERVGCDGATDQFFVLWRVFEGLGKEGDTFGHGGWTEDKFGGFESDFRVASADVEKQSFILFEA